MTPGIRKLTVKTSVKPKSTGGSAYRIAYRQKSTRTWKYTTTTSYSKTIKNLKVGKVYYVKVRAYKKVGSVTYYGNWSTTKLSGKIKGVTTASSRPSMAPAVGTVYWTPNGKVYHKTRYCSTLARSKTIYSGTKQASGKPRICKVCG